ncbi:ankyrin repeat-containing domain protein, partial [Immersiella caudata]
TGLHVGARHGKSTLVKALLESEHVSPNMEDASGQTPLSIALSQGFHDIALALIYDGRTDLDLDTIRTPQDAKGGELRLLALLSSDDVDPNQWDNDGKTCLSLAVRGGHAHICSAITTILQDPRVDPMALDNKKQTALYCAVSVNFLGAVKVLLRDGRVDPNAQDEMGNTATHRAVTRRHKHVLEMLL